MERAPPDSAETDSLIGEAALAARAWVRRQDGEESAREFLSRASALAARLHSEPTGTTTPRHAGDIARLLECPVVDWLPEPTDEPLVEAGELTLFALDVLETQGREPGEESAQGVMTRAMQNLRPRPDGQQRYVSLRRALIKGATATPEEALETAQLGRLEPNALYQSIGAEAVEEDSGLSHPCPRCGWPMQNQGRTVFCLSPACRRAGASFQRLNGQLTPTGEAALPPPFRAGERVRLKPGIWHYTVLPGLTELALAEQLEALPGVTVEYWPDFDRYDLLIRAGEHQYRVDVKDHTSPTTLLASLGYEIAEWIVVPDTRRDQVRILRERGPANMQFTTVSAFVKQIRGVAGS